MISEVVRELDSQTMTEPLAREKVNALNTVAEKLAETDARRALACATEALELSTRVGYHAGMIDSHLNIAWTCFTMSNYTASARHAVDALKWAREHRQLKQEADALNILGNNHDMVGNRAGALECFIEALKIHQATGNKAKIASLMNNIGMVYNKQDNYQKALEYYQQALELDRELGTTGSALGISLVNIADSCQELGDYENALQFARQALNQFALDPHFVGQAHALLQIAGVYSRTDRFDVASQYFQMALEVAHKSEATYHEALINQKMAESLIEQHKLHAALPHLNHALSAFSELEAKPDLYKTHELLAKLHRSTGNFEQALNHFEQFHAIKESVFNEEADSRQKTLQAVFEVQRTRLEAEAHYHKNLALQGEVQQREQMIADLDAYAASVAHDLRNPIGVIAAYSEILVDDLEGRIDENSFKFLENIRAAAYKMDEIVSALLSLAKARKDEIMPRVVDMNRVLQEVQSRIQELVIENQATLNISSSLPPALGDDTWLEEVWMNYLTNAMKYGGSPPHITIGATPLENGFIQYWVKDNGNGLSPQEQEKLFRKYERLSQRKIEGHGLGLAIVKTIVEKLGGQVGVTSSGIPGEGATFSFTLRSV